MSEFDKQNSVHGTKLVEENYGESEQALKQD